MDILAGMMRVMGWASGTNTDGREIGYLIEAECDQDGCATRIDRGLAFVCGGEHDGDEDGCGGYFCADHLVFVTQDRHLNGVALAEKRSPQLCEPCAEVWSDAHPQLSEKD